MSQYIRLKRRNQTVFMHCEPGELLSAVRDRLAVLLDMNEEDIKLYPYMTEEKKQAYFQQCEEKAKEAAKNAKKERGGKGTARKASDKDSTPMTPALAISTSTEETIEPKIPPLELDKKLWELGIENDQVVFFVVRIPDTDDDWEEIDVEGYQTPNTTSTTTTSTQKSHDEQKTQAASSHITPRT